MDVLAVSVSELVRARQQKIEDRLSELQAAVRTAADDLQAAESQRSAAAAAVACAEQQLALQIEVTKEHLDAAGLGIRPDMAAKAPRSAEREFEGRVRSSQPCQASQQVVDDAKTALKESVAAVRTAADDLQAMQNNLQQFVQNLLRV